MTQTHLFKLDDDERVLTEVRRHMFVFYNRVFLLFVFALVPLFAFKPLAVYDLVFPGLVLYFLWLVVLWILFFLRWTDHYFDVWIVTNRRVIDIEQRGIFNRDVSTFHLKHIQDVTTETKGIFATLLKYGDIHVHTAGEKKDFILTQAASPHAVKETLMDRHADFHDHTNAPQTP